MLSLPLTRAQDWGYAFRSCLWPLFLCRLWQHYPSGQSEEFLLPCYLPGDSLSNLTVAPLAARAYGSSCRHFFGISDVEVGHSSL